MTVSSIDFSAYEYVRMSVITPKKLYYFPPKTEEVVLRLFGNCTLVEENPVGVNEYGWLEIRIVAEETAENA